VAGHLAEMLKASRKSAELDMRQVPVLPGCQALIDSGIESTLAPDNRLVTEKVEFEADVQSPRLASLFDPQTSGGLLFGIPEAHTESVLRFLKDEGFEDSAIIGHVVENQKGREVLKID
jgi:selenide,water dikinase